MPVWKIAYLHMANNKKKSVLILIILCTISLLVLTCLTMRKAVRVAEQEVKHSFGGTIRLLDKEQEVLTEDFLNRVTNIQGIKSYNAGVATYADYQTEDGKPLVIVTDGAFDIYENFENTGIVSHYKNIKESDEMLNVGFELVAGDVAGVVVHEKLAEINGLKKGDSIHIAIKRENESVGDKKTIEALITGIYKNNVVQETGFLLSHLLWENLIYMNEENYKRLNDSDHIYYEQVYLSVKDPSAINEILLEMERMDSDIMEKVEIEIDNITYQKAQKSLM